MAKTDRPLMQTADAQYESGCSAAGTGGTGEDCGFPSESHFKAGKGRRQRLQMRNTKKRQKRKSSQKKVSLKSEKNRNEEQKDETQIANNGLDKS